MSITQVDLTVIALTVVNATNKQIVDWLLSKDGFNTFTIIKK